MSLSLCELAKSRVIELVLNKNLKQVHLLMIEINRDALNE